MLDTSVSSDDDGQMTDREIADLDSLLTGFRSGKVSLSNLIDEVPGVVKRIDLTDPTWHDRFVGYWWTLEQVHAEAIDLGESSRLPSDRRTVVDEAIDGMIDLVAEVKA